MLKVEQINFPYSFVGMRNSSRSKKESKTKRLWPGLTSSCSGWVN